MATYLYECPIHSEFEEEHSMKTKLDFCPKCKENGVETAVKRLINCVTKGVVELYGQDLIDKVKVDSKNLQKEAAENANKYASLLGEDRYHKLQTQMDRRRRR